MRTFYFLTALTALTSATPIAQNGHWLSDDYKPGETKAVADPPQPSTTIAAPTIPSPSSTGTPTKPSLLGNPNAKPNPSPNASLVASLITAASQSQRLTLLSDAEKANAFDFKFDFSPAANPAVTPGAGGAVILADRSRYPLLTNLGVAFAGLFFAPCGLNTPHIHPRATEVLTVVTDGTITSGFVLDNVFTMEIAENLTQFQGMAFPQGSIHWQLNNECTPQVAIAGFSSEDPGASSIAQRFLVNTDGDIVEATLGFPEQITPDNFAAVKKGIPAPFVNGIEQCYKKCGITH